MEDIPRRHNLQKMDLHGGKLVTNGEEITGGDRIEENLHELKEEIIL